MKEQDTLVIIKPHAVLAGKVGRILQRYEDADIIIRELGVVWFTEDEAGQIESAASARQVWTAAPSIYVVLSGDRAIRRVAAMNGREMCSFAEGDHPAPAGTVRGDLGSRWPEDAVWEITHPADFAPRYEHVKEAATRWTPKRD